MCTRILNLKFLSLAFLSFVIFLAGCGSESNPEKLQGRLNAAIEISDTNKRNLALVTVAKDAGNAGNGDVAQEAVGKISDSRLRSSTAADTAVALAAAGDSEAATELAKQISDNRERNRVLEKIAVD